MITLLLLVLAVSTTPFNAESLAQLEEKKQEIKSLFQDMVSLVSRPSTILKVPANPINTIKAMLYKDPQGLSPQVIQAVLGILECTKNIGHKEILSIIDYSRPSNEKRLWIFSLSDKKLLFHTYVSHGIRSGSLLSQYFSNTFNSKASSIGVYQTGQTYYGRDGLSLRFTGLDPGFNSNATNRYIVMHGGWYVSEEFIKKYGRPGRSWGCPAVPEELKAPIINTIKDNSLFVAYYPHDNWFSKSRFLHCNTAAANRVANLLEHTKPIILEEDKRAEVLFAHVGGRQGVEGNEAVLVMSADNYAQAFHSPAPLDRMLRRQIEKKEYIALSRDEFKSIANSQNNPYAMYLVVPVIIMSHGYYETQMHIVDTVKTSHASAQDGASPSVETNGNRVFPLRGSKVFVRWLGL